MTHTHRNRRGTNVDTVWQLQKKLSSPHIYIAFLKIILPHDHRGVKRWIRSLKSPLKTHDHNALQC